MVGLVRRQEAHPQGILQGHAAAHRAGPGAHQRPGAGHPRRADLRPRPARHALDEGPHPRPAQEGQDDPHVQPPAGRRAGRLRPHRHPVRRRPAEARQVVDAARRRGAAGSAGQRGAASRRSCRPTWRPCSRSTAASWRRSATRRRRSKTCSCGSSRSRRPGPGGGTCRRPRKQPPREVAGTEVRGRGAVDDECREHAGAHSEVNP